MDVSLGQALDTLGEFSWLLLSIVALHAAVQVRKYQDNFPTQGVQHVLRGVLATLWFGMGSAVVQALLLSEPIESLALPVGACVVAYLAVSFCPSDVIYKTAQKPFVNAILIIGLEICRAMCVGIGVSSALKVYSGNLTVSALMGVLRGAWGWLFGRPIAKVILGRSLSDMSWPAPPLSAPASCVAAVLLVLASSRSDAEMIIGVLIAVLVAWRTYEIINSD